MRGLHKTKGAVGSRVQLQHGRRVRCIIRTVYTFETVAIVTEVTT